MRQIQWVPNIISKKEKRVELDGIIEECTLDGWVDGCKKTFKNCSEQSNIFFIHELFLVCLSWFDEQNWNSPMLKLCNLSLWLALFQLKTLLEEKNVKVVNLNSDIFELTKKNIEYFFYSTQVLNYHCFLLTKNKFTRGPLKLRFTICTVYPNSLPSFL